MLTGSYNPIFVVLSVVIATMASYAALDLAGRVTASAGTARAGWLVGGATVMGLGIWSMHFVGMLAFHLSTPIAYQLPLMLLSVLVAIAASLLALVVVSRPALGGRTLLPAGVLMGAAISGMHYVGMASMHVAGGMLHYDTRIVALSILIAVIASVAALWLAFRFRSVTSARGRLFKALSALLMGVAISALVLGEAIELSLIAAMAMILGGIVIGTMSRSKPDTAMAVQPIPASARPSRQSP